MKWIGIPVAVAMLVIGWHGLTRKPVTNCFDSPRANIEASSNKRALVCQGDGTWKKSN
ncbi:hypothetical protein LMG22037_05929 [Paraburkholderia phenoliruptrix]|uniref:Uncharacterized protein n=1 Tax=Paraburkholderia phenoliruptrix TaxID=252970 RepID=A0A6J5CE28_9BURK|nr:hypothetical protein LMG22037_05929 [Paraburkholderia phenoliruptrix]